LKVVFDTNIYISALVLPGSRADAAMLRFIESKDHLLISKAILDELLGVLARKFSRYASELARIAVFLAEIAEVVRPSKRLHVLDDEPDNRILECAVAGKADAIVTGDKALLKLKKFEGIRILSLKEYLETN
jgi:putative PIN family toxin of toxin-antitoxin system